MSRAFEPRLAILPAAQREIWPLLAPSQDLQFVLYGGTAVALQLGHRESLDFDFFRSAPLDKEEVRKQFGFSSGAAILQDAPNTLVVSANMPSGSVKVSFFGGIGFGRANDPLQTTDGTMFVASLEDLLATKLKAILDRAEAKDYRDIAEMISAGMSLPRGLAAFREMFGGEPAQVLRAIGFFEDGDLRGLNAADRRILCEARDRVGALPDVPLRQGLV
ncbi:nucleotidyl transferase AbiEii/AbiGii toxin family protein [Bradyrhizobium liaoningense]|uniref:nucleotidyl transferase AbiEii/AbiGii toxin family protein n=1 Tax=Bradyrhizobium liaoningense TaxID=43992 RepID=UPI001BA72571|nr:nucleotidyl transferase AbiEii/AbiGii toxin family protein [Bradyrhizobium liaoningense]MBR0984563.1 nucleotidyl transferase AbiEii/AbiGii toxin family protein [Bradyrhizobium liaoningense]